MANCIFMAMSWGRSAPTVWWSAPGGYLEGDIIARDVRIEGRLAGRIFALNVTLDSAAEVTGRIFHNTITVAKGARIDARMPWRPPSYFETLEQLPEVESNEHVQSQ